MRLLPIHYSLHSLLAMAVAVGVAASADAATIVPDYSHTFQDAVTGDNQFTHNVGSSTYHGWFINTGADDYFSDVYERPTSQNYEFLTAGAKVGNDAELVVGNTYSATAFSNAAYYGYIDIVSARFGFDDQYMYFAIELFSENKVGNDGVITADFGESAYYDVRLSADPDGAFGLNLAVESAKLLDGTFKPIPGSLMAYYDEDGSIGGVGGILVPAEQVGVNGYDPKVVNDGKLKDTTPETEVLFARKITNANGRPVIEIAFDYVAFNAADFTSLNPDPDFLPANLNYLDFDATRGLKGSQNYLWNDKYTFDQAGTPYDPLNEPENIYELDTLRADFRDQGPVPIPEPTSLLSMAVSFATVLLASRVRRRTATSEQRFRF